MNQVRRLQYFAADSPWCDRPFLERHRQAVGPSWAHERASPGGPGGHDRHVQAGDAFGGRGPAVLRSAGWLADCQAGVFVVYAGEGGATLVHRRLFLTEAWAGDAAYAERRCRCGVPEEATAFRTKPQLAQAADRTGGRRLTTGPLGELRLGLRPVGGLPGRGGGPGSELRGGGDGRHAAVAGAATDRRAPHPPAAGAGAPASLEAQLPADAWTRHRVPGDSRGPEYADFAIQRVVASRDSLPGPDVWLVLRRQPGADPVRVFLCHAPRRVKPARLAYLTGARWAIETCCREGKQLLGLGNYEGRSWQGWHRHRTLCLLLHFFLLRDRLAKKIARPDPMLGCGDPGPRVGPASQPALGRTRSAMPRPPPVPTPGDAWWNSHPDFSLQ